MAQGFLSGAILGGVIGLGATGLASVMAPPPMPPEVSDAAPGAAAAPTQTEVDSGESGSAADVAPVVGLVVPQGLAPDPDTIASLDGETLATAAQPETSEIPDLESPAQGAQGSGVALNSEAPVLPNPLALAPMEPQPADTLSISTEPAQPPAPVVDETQSAFAAAEGEAPEETALADAEPPTVSSQASAVAPVPADEVALEQPEEAASENTEIAALEPVNLPDPQIQPIAPPAAIVPPQPIAPETEAIVEPEQEPTSQATVRPVPGTPAVSLPERENGVIIRRPSSNTPLGELDDGEATEVASETSAPIDEDTPPIVRFAEPFEDPAGKPLMSIVLIDNGASAVTGAAGIAALRGFPYPLSFAVDASLADAADRMAIYRAAGFEVLAMVDLPEGAQPSDVETTFGAILPRLPEAVAVLEGTVQGLQGSRDVADQVTAILGQTGHGLLTQNKGLNTVPKLARKEGVPAEPVFRDFDSKGQTAAVIRRFMDQAAFKAGQEGAVVMLGRMRPDTISALLLWGLQDRAGKVALVPISAVLTRED